MCKNIEFLQNDDTFRFIAARSVLQEVTEFGQSIIGKLERSTLGEALSKQRLSFFTVLG